MTNQTSIDDLVLDLEAEEMRLQIAKRGLADAEAKKEAALSALAEAEAEVALRGVKEARAEKEARIAEVAEGVQRGIEAAQIKLRQVIEAAIAGSRR